MTSTKKEIHETRLLTRITEMLPLEGQVAAYIAKAKLARLQHLEAKAKH